MNYDGKEIANFILDYCESRGRPVSNLSLQKILYFLHVWTLIKYKSPLIRHDFEAWQYGPVLPYVYREFKKYKARPIKSRATKICPKLKARVTAQAKFSNVSFRHFLEEITEFYSSFSAHKLVEYSHAVNSPWATTFYQGASTFPGMKINNSSIIEYYSSSNDDFKKLGEA